MDTLIAIPSLGRSSNILTLNNFLLKDCNADIIIVVPSEEIDIYRCSVEDNKYDVEVVGCDEKGIGKTRTWILQTYSMKYDYIIMIDDDLKHIKRVRESGVEPLELKFFIEEMKEELVQRNGFFGGITLCPNVFFAKDKVSENLKYISGALQIFRSSDRPIVINNLRHFEDYYNCIEYFLRDGKIIRWNGVIPETKNYNPNGGICKDYGSLEARLKDAELVADEMIKRYGDRILRKVIKRRSGRCPECINLRLNHNYTCPTIE